MSIPTDVHMHRSINWSSGKAQPGKGKKGEQRLVMEKGVHRKLKDMGVVTGELARQLGTPSVRNY